MTSQWTPIVKGDRKPPGYLLVTCTYQSGPIETFSRVRIARWNKTRHNWQADDPRGEKIINVTAWAPLPEPYEATP
jgi:hypothetical protein